MPIRDEQVWGLANKAVRGYVNKQFAKYFTKEEVEDMVADVALRIVKARDKFDEERGCLNAWVWTIAVNVVKTAGKAKSNRTAFAERIEEMAKKEGTSVQNVYMILHHMRQRLRAQRVRGAA